MKKFNVFLSALFCLFLGGMLVVSTLLPDKDFSPLENRYLQKPPKLSLETLSDGSFMEDAEDYVSDHIVGRDFWVAAKAWCERLSGKQENNGVYFGKEDTLLNRVDTPSWEDVGTQKGLQSRLDYVDALVDEIRAGGAMAREQDLRVRAFYMGGGTPTTLTAEQMDRVLAAFETAFDTRWCSEITVEAGRPDTITAEKLEVLKRHGVTRVSVNPQTMEDHVLRAIGRRHSAAEIETTMALVAKYGFPHVNMDLIAGLPEDTEAGFRRSLERCLDFGTDNITVHTLALKKGSRILTEGLAVPEAEAVAAMLDFAEGALRGAGYGPYYLYRQKYMSGSFENIGWTRPGGVCWYNVYIMSELCSILSFGAGGSTKMVVPGTNRIQRVFNLKYPKEYTERPEKALANLEAFAAFYDQL